MAPEIYDGIVKKLGNKNSINAQKADVFALGMSVLAAGTDGSTSSVYDGKGFDTKDLFKKQNEFGQRYFLANTLMCDILDLCLECNADQRLTAGELLAKVPPYAEIKNHYRSLAHGVHQMTVQHQEPVQQVTEIVRQAPVEHVHETVVERPHEVYRAADQYIRHEPVRHTHRAVHEYVSQEPVRVIREAPVETIVHAPVETHVEKVVDVVEHPVTEHKEEVTRVVREPTVIRHEPTTEVRRVENVVRSEPHVIRSSHHHQSSVIRTGEPHVVRTGESHVVRSEPQVIRHEPRVISSEPQVIRQSHTEVVRGEPRVIYGEPQIIRGEPRVISSGENVIRSSHVHAPTTIVRDSHHGVVRTEGHVSTGNVIRSSHSHVVTGEPRVIHGEPRVIHGETRVIHGESHVSHGEPHVIRQVAGDVVSSGHVVRSGVTHTTGHTLAAGHRVGEKRASRIISDPAEVAKYKANLSTVREEVAHVTHEHVAHVNEVVQDNGMINADPVQIVGPADEHHDGEMK
jgi:hypothetical protein